MASKTGILICGHGSRAPETADECARVADAIAARRPDEDVAHGFLELAKPDLRDGLERLRTLGNDRIVAVPAMLFEAGHVKRDIPDVLEAYQAEFPGIEITFGGALDIDEKMIAAAAGRIEDALKAASADVPMDETLLMVIGRGATDEGANLNVIRIMRALWDRCGFGWAEAAYAGATFPRVENGLDRAARLGFRRIVVLPYLLFTGALVTRVYRVADELAAANPELDVVKAGYLNDHPLVIETFLDRIDEAGRGLLADGD